MQIFKINPKNPQKDAMHYAGRVIQQSGLVAFPTETVYGLGANAFDKKAVEKIFKAKGRPADNPLIVHIAKKFDVEKLAKNVSAEAYLLMKKFWPGPLTLVLKKKEAVPDSVTAGTDTVAIRMPNNMVALAFIKSAGVPIAAPSANISGRPSPTSAQHVAHDLGDKVDLILDGGQTKIGLESTVIDLTEYPFKILRPGAITKEMIEKALKEKIGVVGKVKVAKSPGMKYRHYSPRTPLILVTGNSSRTAKKIRLLARQFQKKHKEVGILAAHETAHKYKVCGVVIDAGSRKNLSRVSQSLYAALRKFDDLKVDVILAEGFEERGLGAAIMNRLTKAAARIVR